MSNITILINLQNCSIFRRDKMATIQDLIDSIDNVLQHPLGILTYKNSSFAYGKIYEAYVFCLCLRAIHELNVIPSYRGINGAPNPFVFRGAPGKISSKSRNYGYVEFKMKEHSFEIHTGIEFRGTSGMTHELDICIMRASEARSCRESTQDPPPASLIGGWECKFYSGKLHK